MNVVFNLFELVAETIDDARRKMNAKPDVKRPNMTAPGKKHDTMIERHVKTVNRTPRMYPALRNVEIFPYD